MQLTEYKPNKSKTPIFINGSGIINSSNERGGSKLNQTNINSTHCILSFVHQEVMMNKLVQIQDNFLIKIIKK